MPFAFRPLSPSAAPAPRPPRVWRQVTGRSLLVLLLAQAFTLFVAVPLAASHLSGLVLADLCRLAFAGVCIRVFTRNRLVRALLVAGRRDDMMTLGTIKILPAEIEAVAEGFPGLRDCAAFAVRAPALGDIPVLAVVGDAGFDAAGLLAHCRARLGLRAPRKVVAVDAIPRNAMGKVLRQQLAEMAR